MTRSRLTRGWWQVRWPALLASCLLSGCSCSSSTSQAPTAKPAEPIEIIEAVTQTVQAASGLSKGNVDLLINGPIKIDRCFARFTPPGHERPGVLQLMTYEKLNPTYREEGLPSVLLWADVSAQKASELVGQSIPGHLFVQGETASVLFASPPTRPVEIKIAAVDAWSVTCEVKDVELTQVENEQPIKASGKLVGLWK
jgi:hypothetical protein